MFYKLEPVFNDKTITIDQISHWDYSLTLGEKQPNDMPEPIEYEVDTDIASHYLPTTFLPEPVFSVQFIQELIACRVNNIQTYEVSIKNPDTNLYIEGYQAVNIIGKVPCANVDVNKYDELNKGQHTFKKMALKSFSDPDLLIFRLTQYTQLILIHEIIVKQLSAEVCKDLNFERVDEI
ncbi:hypothetical protein MNBD_GAMMA12-2661 [hydrothermal vent metagenome]|uniref:Uncharacterized protein n=1 Tax=hydrothermal vent metagenome TaxID=652676 RepID=A0A3B0Z415_9ZZZZ